MDSTIFFRSAGGAQLIASNAVTSIERRETNQGDRIAVVLVSRDTSVVVWRSGSLATDDFGSVHDAMAAAQAEANRIMDHIATLIVTGNRRDQPIVTLAGSS